MHIESLMELAGCSIFGILPFHSRRDRKKTTAKVGHCPKRKGGQNPSRQQRQGTNSIGGSVTVPNTDTSREQHFKRKGEVGDRTQNELGSA